MTALPTLLRAAAREMDRLVLTRLHGRGFDQVSVHDLDVLPRLEGAGCALVTLADHLGLSPQGAGAVVRRLETKGLTERSPHPRDGRAVLVGLTSRGRDALEALGQATRDVLDVSAEGLDEGRLAVLCRTLATLAFDPVQEGTWR